MGNWLSDIGVKLTYRGTWDAASGDFPLNPHVGDWWIAGSTGTMLQIGSPALSLSVVTNDHFMYADGEFKLISSQGEKFSYFDGSTIPSPYTAEPPENILVDTSAGPLTVRLPATPNLFDRVDVISALPTYDVNNLTVDPQGLSIGGVFDTMLITENGLSVSFVWVGGDLGWVAYERGDALVNTVADDSGISFYVDIQDAGSIGHNHVTYLTDAEVRDLVTGEVAQVVKSSSLAASHSHLITFTYSNGLFDITIGTNHPGQEHVPVVLGFEGYDPEWILIDSPGSPVVAFPAQARDHILVDTYLYPLTIALPASPTINNRIRIVPARPTYSTNSLTIDNNGNPIGGVTDTVEVDVDGLALEFIWVGGDVGWVVNEGTGPAHTIYVDLIQPAVEWSYRNTNFTAVDFGHYLVDTTLGPITVTLPQVLSSTFSVTFKDAKGTFDVNNLIIQPGVGATYTLVNDGSNPLIVDKRYYTVNMVYDSSSNNLTI